MSFLDRLYIEYLTAYKFFRKKLDRRTMVGRDIKRQTAALKDYAHDINEVTQFDDSSSGPFCLFVFYEADDRVPASAAPSNRSAKPPPSLRASTIAPIGPSPTPRIAPRP